MTTITIAIANQKGGVGKTTTAVTLATGLADRGYKTVLVDMDPQGHCATYLGISSAPGVFQLLVAKLPLAQLLVPVNEQGNLVLLPGDRETAVAKVTLAARQTIMPAEDLLSVLSNALAPLQRKVDFIIMDSAPTVDPLGLAILYASDYVLIPLVPEQLALDGLRQITNSIAQLRSQHNAKVRLLGVLPTMYDRRTKEHREQLKHLVEVYGHLVYPIVIKAIAVAESTAYQEPLWTYAPNNQATKQYLAVLERVLRDVT